MVVICIIESIVELGYPQLSANNLRYQLVSLLSADHPKWRTVAEYSKRGGAVIMRTGSGRRYWPETDNPFAHDDSGVANYLMEIGHTTYSYSLFQLGVLHS